MGQTITLHLYLLQGRSMISNSCAIGIGNAIAEEENNVLLRMKQMSNSPCR